MTELIYLTDSYMREGKSRVVSCSQKGKTWEIVLDKTIFYPQGGGQLSDRGEIIGKHGKALVKHVRMHEEDVIHECSVEGSLEGTVTCHLDWDWRYLNMRRHSGGHVVHEAVMQIAPSLKPLRADHGKHMFIEYEGSLPIDKKYEIEKIANDLVSQNLPLKTEIVSYEEVIKRAAHIAGALPKNKPLRLLQIGDFPPMPDGGTQVAKTGEVGALTVTNVENTEETVRVYYEIDQTTKHEKPDVTAELSASTLVAQLLELERQAADAQQEELIELKNDLASLTKQIRLLSERDRQQVGVVVTQVKKTIESALEKTTSDERRAMNDGWFDVTMPGIRPQAGHLHIASQAIMEITRIFERIGFTRVRHPEVDWDWYAFESLNMPKDHPARDEWETFFISKNIVLTPHTSNGQVREMEKKTLPIRMINIAKCYRRQIDVSHTPMFHQFEGLYVDKHVSIGDLKGVFDFFVKNFFGPKRQTRLRPFHFQFTEPSFEVDITCGICLGAGCKLCKSGWLELGGAGMVHPAVLKNGGIDPEKYNGFAFGWGIERTSMMKSGTQLDDIRLLYSNDIRFLEQF